MCDRMNVYFTPAMLKEISDLADRKGQRLERNIGISTETLALFVRFWLTITPPCQAMPRLRRRSKPRALRAFHRGARTTPAKRAKPAPGSSGGCR
jgi:hypothetical protein